MSISIKTHPSLVINLGANWGWIVFYLLFTAFFLSGSSRDIDLSNRFTRNGFCYFSDNQGF